MNLDNWPYKQHELLKTALEATDAYLGVEKHAKAAGHANNVMIHDFSYHMSRAHDALQQIGILDQHQEYMTMHVQIMSKLADHDDPTLSDLPFAHVPNPDYGDVEESVQVNEISNELLSRYKEKASQQASAADKEGDYAKGNKRFSGIIKATNKQFANDLKPKTEDKKFVTFSNFLKEETAEKKSSDSEELTDQEIQDIVDELTWEDIVDLYNDPELVYQPDEEETEIEEELLEDFLDERLSVQARIKKRQAFARMRSKRNVARSIKLRRTSDLNILKKRAKLAARRAVYKRFLRGRNKSDLSAAEKDRIEQQVARLKYMQDIIATKMLPKMRGIEQKRLAGYRTRSGSAAPGGAGTKRSTGTKAPGGAGTKTKTKQLRAPTLKVKR